MSAIQASHENKKKRRAAEKVEWEAVCHVFVLAVLLQLDGCGPMTPGKLPSLPYTLGFPSLLVRVRGKGMESSLHRGDTAVTSR